MRSSRFIDTHLDLEPEEAKYILLGLDHYRHGLDLTKVEESRVDEVLSTLTTHLARWGHPTRIERR